MQIQMTESDKKLITGLAVFVILVAGGYWGVYPMVKNIMSYTEQIADEETTRELNEIKIAQVSVLEIDNERVEKDMASLKESFYPMMTSDQVDRYMTGLILDNGLYSYDLDIQMPEEEAFVEPYQYSQKAAEAEAMPLEEESADAEDLLMGDGSSDTQADDTGMDELFTYEDVPNGIHEVQISMRVGGRQEQLEQLIDDLSATDQKMHLKSYSWDEIRGIKMEENGDYNISLEKILTINLSLYMCEDIS